MVRYLFKKIETVEELLKVIGKGDIPSNKVIIKEPSIDEETGEIIADFEIEIPDEHALNSKELIKLKQLMLSKGLMLVKIVK